MNADGVLASECAKAFRKIACRRHHRIHNQEWKNSDALFEPLESSFHLYAREISRIKEAFVPIYIGDASPKWSNHDQHYLTTIRFPIQNSFKVYTSGNINKIAENTLIPKFSLQLISDTANFPACVFAAVRYKNLHIKSTFIAAAVLWQCNQQLIYCKKLNIPIDSHYKQNVDKFNPLI